jgi:hypothetical protein
VISVQQRLPVWLYLVPCVPVAPYLKSEFFVCPSIVVWNPTANERTELLHHRFKEDKLPFLLRVSLFSFLVPLHTGHASS